jgi:hypothetical protein
VKYQQGLQLAICERLNRLLAEHWDTGGHQIGLITRWIETQPALVAILREAEQVEPDVDVAAFEQACLVGRRQLVWPIRTEEGQAALVWKLMKRLSTSPPRPDGAPRPIKLGMSTNINDSWCEFVKRVLAPLFDFLAERVGEGSSILHVIERYVHVLEWFDRTELYTKSKAARATGEEIYNNDLQRFLFEDGGYITYAEVRSASGEAYLTGGLEAGESLICEGKLFDDRGVRYLASGLHQVVKYAHDQGKGVAYLVVFNMTDRLLQFPTEDPADQWPPYLEITGVRVYLGCRSRQATGRHCE